MAEDNDEKLNKQAKEYLQELRDRAAAQKAFTKEQKTSLNTAERLSEALAEGSKFIDKSGTLAKILSNELSASERSALVFKASMGALISSALKVSDFTTNIAKSTGISSDNAKEFQKELVKSANASGKIFITSERLNKSFSTLTAQTGLVADFGGDTLKTFTELNTVLKLSEEQSGKLSLLARLQSKDTRGILENTTKTIGTLIKQKGVAISGRTVLEDVSNVTSDIAVSLGMNPKLIAEAAVEARTFGANLNDVNKIAGNLLNFESSIEAELQAELLTGKQLNFERARLLALNNDLAGVSQELVENEALRSEFLSGNRLEQEAIAQAIGLSREEMSNMVMQSEFNRLSAEAFKDEYGEITFNQLASLSASEKLQESFNKIKAAVVDVGMALLPLVDQITAFITKLAESENLFPRIAAAFTTIATLSLIGSMAQILGSFTLAFGPIGAILGTVAAGAAGYFAYNKAQSLVGQVKDGVIDPKGGLLVSGEKGTIQLDKNDSIIAGTNLGGNTNQTTVNTNLEGIIDYDRMALAMSRAQINVSTRYDSFGARKVSAFNGSYQRDVRENSSFV